MQPSRLKNIFDVKILEFKCENRNKPPRFKHGVLFVPLESGCHGDG